jgi:hypothetical protein
MNHSHAPAILDELYTSLVGSLRFMFRGTANGRFEISLQNFRLYVFVSYFLSCVERIMMYFSFKTASLFTLYCLIP